MPKYCCDTMLAEPLDVSYMQCSRCKLAFYRSREAQLRHWKYHKKSCTVPSEDIVNAMSISSCLKELAAVLTCHTPANGNTGLILRRIKYALQNPSEDPSMNPKDIGMELCKMTRLFIPNDARAVTFYRVLWGAPGVTDFLLNECLVSGMVQMEADMFPNGYTVDKLPPVQQELVMNWESNPDLSAQQIGYVVFNILLQTAVAGSPSMSPHKDGVGDIRCGMDELVFACSQKILDLFLNSAARKSCGDLMTAAAGFVRTVLTKKLECSEISVVESEEMETFSANLMTNLVFDEVKLLSVLFDAVAEGLPEMGYAFDILEKLLPGIFTKRATTSARDTFSLLMYRDIFHLSVRFLFRARVAIENAEEARRAKKVANFYIFFVIRCPTRCMRVLEDTVRYPYKKCETGVLTPLEAFDEDSKVHAFVVFVLAKIKWEALLSAHRSCRDGISSVFEKYKCNNNRIISTIAMFAGDPEETLGLRTEGDKFMELLTVWGDLLYDPKRSNVDRLNFLFPSWVPVKTMTSMKMCCYKEILPENEFKAVVELFG